MNAIEKFAGLESPAAYAVLETGNVGIQYRWFAGALGLPGHFLGRLAYQHVASRAADVADAFELDCYDIVNARLAWGQNLGVPAVRVGHGHVIGIGFTAQF